MENNESIVKSSLKKKPASGKITFNQKVELIQLEIDELRLKTEQVAELRNLLSQTVENEEEQILSNTEYQKRVHVFNDEEREKIKSKIFELLEKYFK